MGTSKQSGNLTVGQVCVQWTIVYQGGVEILLVAPC